MPTIGAQTQHKTACVVRRGQPDAMGVADWMILIRVPGRQVAIVYHRGLERAVVSALCGDGYVVSVVEG